MQHIYTAPSSVGTGEEPGLARVGLRRGNNCERMGITALTPRAIAYACVQVIQSRSYIIDY